MAYRSDLEALRARETALARELDEIGDVAARKARVEAELYDVRHAMRGVRQKSLGVLRAPPIALPCDVPWDSMAGDARVRFCGQCAKNVYNLSAMTQREATELMERDGAACVRYYERPDGTVLTSDCPVGARRRRRRRAVAGVAGIAAFGVVTAVVAGAASRPIELVSVDRLADDVGEGRFVRAEGTLVRGSIDRSHGDVRFTLESHGVLLPVRYTSGLILPDNFRDDVDVPVAAMVEGKLGPDGTFVASMLLAKVPSGSRYMDPAARMGRDRLRHSDGVE